MQKLLIVLMIVGSHLYAGFSGKTLVRTIHGYTALE